MIHIKPKNVVAGYARHNVFGAIILCNTLKPRIDVAALRAATSILGLGREYCARLQWAEIYLIVQ